jgi:hypothetical protein
MKRMIGIASIALIAGCASKPGDGVYAYTS